jgi:hypothetical protein
MVAFAMMFFIVALVTVKVVGPVRNNVSRLSEWLRLSDTNRSVVFESEDVINGWAFTCGLLMTPNTIGPATLATESEVIRRRLHSESFSVDSWVMMRTILCLRLELLTPDTQGREHPTQNLQVIKMLSAWIAGSLPSCRTGSVSLCFHCHRAFHAHINRSSVYAIYFEDKWRTSFGTAAAIILAR